MRSVFLVLLPYLWQNAKSSPVLFVRSELKAAPASPTAHHQCPGEPEITCGGVGEQPKHSAEGQSCYLEIPFPPTNKTQEHFTYHFHIYHSGIPALVLGHSHAYPAQDPDPPPAITGSAKSPSFRTADPLSSQPEPPKKLFFPQICLLQDTRPKGFGVSLLS